MTKIDLINEIKYEMQNIMDKQAMDRLEIILLVKMKDFELTAIKQLPSTEVKTNDWAFKRFEIDMYAQGLEEGTMKQYMYAVKKFFDITGKNFREVTGQDITDYLFLYQYKYKIGNTYKALLLCCLRAFFRWAYRKHYIDQDITIDTVRVKIDKKKKERLTDEEVEDIRDVLKTVREKALFELLMSTGIRVSEVVRLDISDVDLRERTVSIYADKTNEYRVGFLSQAAAKALKKYIDNHPGNEKALFVSERSPYQRLQKGGIQEITKEIGRRADVHVVTTVHVFRKTFASILYRKTHDLLYVSKLLGHKDTEVTVDRYLIDDLDDMKMRHRNSF